MCLFNLSVFREIKFPLNFATRSTAQHLPVGNLGQHVLRHDDRILQLLDHERVVPAAAAAGLVVRLEPLVQLNHRRRRLHQLVDNVGAELVGHWKQFRNN